MVLSHPHTQVHTRSRELELAVTESPRLLLVDEERSGYQRSQEGSQSETEMYGVHVGSTVPALPDLEDDHIAGGVHVAATEPGDEGTDIEVDQIGTVGIGGQGRAHRQHTSLQ